MDPSWDWEASVLLPGKEPGLLDAFWGEQGGLTS